MSTSRVLLAVALMVAFSASHAKYSIEEAGLRVIYPPPSDRSKVIRMAMADFGKPKYGGSLRGQLVYPNPVINVSCFPRECKYGCEPFDQARPPINITRKPGALYIMMLERGPRNVSGASACYFLEKVYNAQKAGADAVVVVNDEPGELSTAVAPEDEDTAGMLASLTVSAGMISQEDGEYLRQLLEAGEVTLMVNWSRALPQEEVVSWEFWTSSEDGCGPACDERVNFTKSIREQAQALEQANRTQFTPHYFLWDCKPEYRNTTICKNDCIANGTYCADTPEMERYTGKQVLQMNIRSLCFFRLAASVGKTHLWWDYAARIATNCTMAADRFDETCAGEVFASLGDAEITANKTAWDTCSAVDATAASIPLLEEELAAQKGNANITAVTILPTIRINSGQYRGALEAGPVLRALCAAFLSGQEPAVCNQGWVSDDECQPGGVGYIACMRGEAAAANKTRCVNTFQGYNCECQAGFLLYRNPDTGEERCEDLNECLATNVRLTNPQCSCDRCVCINKLGSYNCTGPLPDLCTSSANYGNCWHNSTAGETFSACIDNLRDYRDLAERGLVSEKDSYTKCQCPACFKEPEGAKGTCVPKCDLATCDRATGVCVGQDDGGKGKTDGGGSAPAGGDGGSGSGGGGGSGGGRGGVGIGWLLLIVLCTVALTAVIVAAANRHLMRSSMGDEIRDIMAQYMPLEERERMLSARNGRGGGGGGGGSSGPPPRVIKPDEDSDEEGAVGPYGWPAAAPARPANPPAPTPTLTAATQRAVWGPAPALPEANTPTTAVAKGLAGGAVPPATASHAAVNVFTISGPDDPLFSEQLPSAVPPAGGRNESDADPLLGRELGSMSSSRLAQAPEPSGAKPTAGGGGADNPFL